MFTFGHGQLDRDQLATLLSDAGISRVIDVRRFPGSRANPASAKGQIPDLLSDIGIDYRWDERLGGRRSLTKADDAQSPDTWWRVKAFRAYAAWTRSPDFRTAVGELATEADTAAYMCSESVWWRCHRRIISDVLVLEHGRDIQHLMHDGRLIAHEPSEGARLGRDGHVVWDGD